MEKKSSFSSPEGIAPSFLMRVKKPLIFGGLAISLGVLGGGWFYLKREHPEPVSTPVPMEPPFEVSSQALPPVPLSLPVPSWDIKPSFKALKIWLQMKEAWEGGQPIDPFIPLLKNLLPNVPSEVWVDLSEPPSVYTLPSPVAFLKSPFLDELWAHVFSIRWGSRRISGEALWAVFDFIPDACEPRIP